jgi:VanZ family protein
MRYIRMVLPWAFWIPFGFASYMAWTPAVHLEISQTHDKITHFLAFGYLTGAFAVAYSPWTTWPRTAGIMLAYAALIEVVQAFIPSRQCSWLDFVTDGLAIFLALSGLSVIHKVIGLLKPGVKTS